MSRSRRHSTLLRLSAVLAVALIAIAVVSDSEASCPEGSECCRSRSGDERPSHGAPAQNCAGRPCRTPLRLLEPESTPLTPGGALSSPRPAPVRFLSSIEPVAPPTPPPIASPSLL